MAFLCSVRLVTRISMSLKGLALIAAGMLHLSIRLESLAVHTPATTSLKVVATHNVLIIEDQSPINPPKGIDMNWTARLFYKDLENLNWSRWWSHSKQFSAESWKALRLMLPIIGGLKGPRNDTNGKPIQEQSTFG